MTAGLKYRSDGLKFRVTWTDPNPLRKMPNSQACDSGKQAMKVARRKARNRAHHPVVIEARRNHKLDQRWTVT